MLPVSLGCLIYRRCYRVRCPPCIQGCWFFCCLQHKYGRADLATEFKINSSAPQRVILGVERARSLVGQWVSFALGLWLAVQIPYRRATRAALGARESRITVQRPGMINSPFFLFFLWISWSCHLMILKSYARRVFVGKCNRILGKKAPVSGGSNATQRQALGHGEQWKNGGDVSPLQ